MRIQGAVIRDQGQTFAVVVVKQHILNTSHQADEAIQTFRSVFPGMPIVLMVQDHRGRATYYGRKDISRFMSRVPLRAIPWREYTLH